MEDQSDRVMERNLHVNVRNQIPLTKIVPSHFTELSKLVTIITRIKKKKKKKKKKK